MDRPDDVEFLDDSGAVIQTDDDVVEFGGRRVSGRVTALISLAVAAVVVAVVATRSAPHEPTGLATPPVIVSQSAEPEPPPGLGNPLQLPVSPAVDAVVTLDRLYTLQFSQLSAISSGVFGVGPDGLDFDRIGGAARLVVDVSANRLWIVVVNSPYAQIFEYDASTLRRLRVTSWPEPITTATALRGVLYFSTSAGVATFGPGAPKPAMVPALRTQTALVVADPRRARLLVIEDATGTRVRAYRPGGGVSPAVGRMAFGKGAVVVTGDGNIWAGGFGDRGAVLTRLDPTTLQPTRGSPVVSRLGPGAILVAAGQRDIWVRNGLGGTGLFCVDGKTGADRQSWSDASGRVTSQQGGAYLVSGTTVRALFLNGCAG